MTNPEQAPRDAQAQPALKLPERPDTDSHVSDQPTQAVPSIERTQPIYRSSGRVASAANHLTDEFRLMRRTLLSLVKTVASAVERSNVIMVASASPGEGKSFIALNLARSMAADRDVLLVDADFKKPELSAVFGLQGRPGLLDVLAGATSFHECVRPAEQPRLSVLPAGPWRDDAGDLLTGRAADELFGSDFAVDPKRIVILDTSPILYTPEPHLVAELVGQIVFVVRAGVTAQGAFEHAVEKIGSTKQRSVILNEANTVPFASHPSYSYAYSAYGPYRAAGAANVQK